MAWGKGLFFREGFILRILFELRDIVFEVDFELDSIAALFRRSLAFSEDIKEKHRVTEEDVAREKL